MLLRSYSKILMFNTFLEELQQTKEDIQKQLDGVKKSILYDLKSRFEQLVHLISMNFTSTETEKQLEILPGLPKNNITDFLAFEKQLDEKEDLKSALVTFIILNKFNRSLIHKLYNYNIIYNSSCKYNYNT